MNKDLFFMQEAIEEAKLGLAEGEVPVGAVLTLNDEIIAKAHTVSYTHLTLPTIYSV